MHSFGPQRIDYTSSHPNVIQIHCAASSGGIYATVYHDGAPLTCNVVFDLYFTFVLDLVPFWQYVNSFQGSHFATVYFYACCVRVHSLSYSSSHSSETVDFQVGKISPLLKFLTPGRQQTIMCISHSNGLW
jgi:hypothetical protein